MQNSNSPSEQEDSKTADFVLQLYLILIGIGFGISIENIFASEFSLPLLFRFITVILLLTIWLQGQIAFGLSESYEEGKNWLGRVIENYIEIVSILIVLSTAFAQDREQIFYGLVIASYAFDLVLEYVYLRRLRVITERYQREKELALSWLIIDLVAVIFMIGVWLSRLNVDFVTELLGSISILVIVFILALWDYSINRDFYFGLEKPVR